MLKLVRLTSTKVLGYLKRWQEELFTSDHMTLVRPHSPLILIEFFNQELNGPYGMTYTWHTHSSLYSSINNVTIFEALEVARTG